VSVVFHRTLTCRECAARFLARLDNRFAVYCPRCLKRILGRGRRPRRRA